MNLLDKIDCKLEKGDLFTLMAPWGSGETTLLCIMASELALSGKNVVYISEDTHFRFLLRKFRNLISIIPKERGTLILRRGKEINEIFEKITDEVDVVILDGYFGNKEDLKTFAENKQLAIMETKQVERENVNGIPTGYPTQIMHRSDVILSLKRTRTVTKLSLLDKFKNKFCFWIPTIVEHENLTLQVLKNRRGKNGSYEYPINFNEINK